jgi:hypothetical protein
VDGIKLLGELLGSDCGKTNRGPDVRLDCGEGQTKVAMDKNAAKFRGAHSAFRHVGP